MLTGVILNLTAFSLALFCLIASLAQRRKPASPESGARSAGLDRHAVYGFTLGALALAALAALVATPGLIAAGPLPRLARVATAVLQGAFFLGFVAYAAALPRGKGSGEGRRAVWPLAAVAVVGVVIQRVWSVQVALFFEAIAAFGGMVLLEGEGESPRRFRRAAALVIALTLVAMIFANATIIMNLSNAQSDEIGNVQLDVIRGDLQETLTGAQTDVLRVALGAEQLLESDASMEALARYFDAQREKYQSKDSFMNTYIAGKDWHIVPGFDAPADFHAAERVWYLGAKDRPGEVYISEPYKDADTGAMCFTVSTLLSDGETVVGMDLNFSKVQESILRMTGEGDRAAMIVTSDGLIVGYTDMSFVGERADEKLPEYAEILRRVTASQEHGSFRARLGGQPCVIFSSETSNHWCLILSVDTSALYAEGYRQMATMASVNLLMLAVVMLYYALNARRIRQAEAVVAENRGHIDRFSEQLRDSAARLLRLGDVRLLREGEDPAELVERVRDSGEQLSALAAEFSSYSGAARDAADAPGRAVGAESLEAPSRRVRNGIIAALLVSLAIVLVFCVTLAINWGATRMNREADSYENQLNEWLTQQRSILYMFTDVIASQPSLIEDYDSAVRWLNDVAGRYPEISLCYMANPYNERPVIMSNGWEPGEDYRPETRPWYRATERAADGFSVSAPYLDAQSGNYCVTLSRVVYGEKGEFLGIFGIDFFLDKLIHVLGESYTSEGYAFLVDSDGIIINHPNEAYQMGGDRRVSIEDTEYAEAYNRQGVSALKDWSGHFMACLSRRTGSGFTVLVANRWWGIYGRVVVVTVLFLALFGLCLAFIVTLINRLIRWQADANRRLVEAAETARNANTAKSRFLSQMSHEIRTPMNAIIGLDNIALRDGDLPPHTREALEKIGASARHLLALINDILDMSRIESGRMTLKEERFSFREILDQIQIIVGGQCEDKGLRFVCNRVEPLDDAFVGDDLKLKQVLINILGNSVKFTDAPGVITFTVAQSPGPDDTAALRFTMEDTGIGMDKEFIPRLFDAFSQEDSGNTNCYGGSGLGMAITKSIVERMGGDIAVESEKGLGTTFTVTVSLKRVRGEALPAGTAAEAPVECAPVAGLRLLIAEDQPLNAEVLADLLELEDIASEWAEDGQKAVEMFDRSEAGHFDAILMDMRMPVMDGLAATRAIRGLDRPDAATIPIVALTANAFEDDVKQCLQAGMNAHLSKPVDMDRLKQTLGRLLAARKAPE